MISNNMSKVLVAIPYHTKKRYCINKVLSRVDELTYESKEVVMRWDTGIFGGTNNVKKQREFFRELLISYPRFTHLYFFGADTIPPADVLERLLSRDKALVGGVYWGRTNAIKGELGAAIAWVNGITPEDQSKLFLKPNSLFKITGMGMDAVLIRRDVLEKLSYMSWEVNDDDYPFYERAKKLGYSCHLDTNVQCKHYFTGKDYVYRNKIYKDKKLR